MKTLKISWEEDELLYYGTDENWNGLVCNVIHIHPSSWNGRMQDEQTDKYIEWTKNAEDKANG